MADTMLKVDGLTVAYGGIHAVKGIGFEVACNELVCLIGCNGAGKTSTLKAIAGLLPFTANSALFKSELNLTTMPAHKRLPNGMACT